MSDEAPRFAFVLACRGRAKPANLAALLLLGLVVAVAPAARGESSVRFSPISLPLETYHVYDLLVADLNADGILDVSPPTTMPARVTSWATAPGGASTGARSGGSSRTRRFPAARTATGSRPYRARACTSTGIGDSS